MKESIRKELVKSQLEKLKLKYNIDEKDLNETLELIFKIEQIHIESLCDEVAYLQRLHAIRLLAEDSIATYVAEYGQDLRQ